jgi:hypothetical protein
MSIDAHLVITLMCNIGVHNMPYSIYLPNFTINGFCVIRGQVVVLSRLQHSEAKQSFSLYQIQQQVLSPNGEMDVFPAFFFSSLDGSEL